jgi:dipicolinate synthase subunit B
MVRKNYFFVPFGQDNPQKKPLSMVADFEKIPQTVAEALEGKQIQPIVVSG